MLGSWLGGQGSFRKTDGTDLLSQRDIKKGYGVCDRMQQVQ
jgi:hypothetical protein